MREGKFGTAEYTSSVGLSMGEKLSGFAKENNGFQARIVRGENSDPLNIHLVWGSVWERNCQDLQRKMMDFRGGWCGGKIRNR